VSTCHKRKAGRKGSGLGAGGVRCHATEGVAEERRGGGSGSGSGRQVGVGSIRGSPYNDLQGCFWVTVYDSTFATCLQSDEFEISMMDNGSGAAVSGIGTSGKSLVSYRLSSSPSKRGTNTFTLQTVCSISSDSGVFDSQFVSLRDSSRISGTRSFSPPLWLPGGWVINSLIHSLMGWLPHSIFDSIVAASSQSTSSSTGSADHAPPSSELDSADAAIFVFGAGLVGVIFCPSSFDFSFFGGSLHSFK